MEFGTLLEYINKQLIRKTAPPRDEFHTGDLKNSVNGAQQEKLHTVGAVFQY